MKPVFQLPLGGLHCVMICMRGIKAAMLYITTTRYIKPTDLLK